MRLFLGGTVTGLGKYRDVPGLGVTLDSCVIADRTIDGPYSSGFYTSHAIEGMNFLILRFTVANTWVREQSTLRASFRIGEF